MKNIDVKCDQEKHIEAVVETPGEPAPTKKRDHRQFAVIVFVALLTLGVFLTTIGAVQGAAEIEYFNALPYTSAVLLEWSTRSEYNVAGFEVLCKLATEPASSYHRIGFKEAKGGPAQGAQYDFLVNRLEPGVAYCFQLHEVTTDEEPGERRELCGYGLNITPTPTSPYITPTITLFPSGIITPGFDGYATPFTPVFPQPDTPLPTPLGMAPDQQSIVAASDSTDLTQPGLDFAQSQPGEGIVDASANPSGPSVPAPLPIVESPPTELPLAIVTVAQPDGPPLSEVAASPTPPTTTLSSDDAAARTSEDVALVAGLVGEPTPTPTSLYVVVTAAPTLAPVALPALLTPWPTVTPVPGAQASSVFAPTAQNLTVMLLCFIFFSATALGALGLITSVLYMRSRSQREFAEMQRRHRGR